MSSFIKELLKKIKYFKYYKKNTFEGVFSIAKRVSMKNCNIGNFANFAEYSSVRNSCIGAYTSIGRYAKITHTDIGKYCAISWDTSINALSHPYTHLTISSFPYVPKTGNFVERRTQSYKKVIIKNDVWIGANCTIMPGIKIGNGAIIGAGSVVTKDVPDYAIVAGVPAKIIKYRFPKNIIDELLRLQWWNLDENIIKDNISIWQNDFTDDSLKDLNKILEGNKDE